ncbi:Fur family transcriptional regulator [Clostridium oceanicum]|uniref:Fur family transcriptional regulator n=1 Tax=Clostridium oceanicum TaxID=1543 RepID=A0ABP3UYP2_9CLOT
MGSQNLLKEKKLKITKARVSILNILNVENHSLSVEDIYNMLKEKGIIINLSTVYRNLEIFSNKNLIQKFIIDDGKSKYILKKHKSPKHIVECKMCHKEIEIECPIPQIDELVTKKTGFCCVDHQLKIKGICKSCIKKKNKTLR